MNRKLRINRKTRAAKRKKEMMKRKTTSSACSISAYSTTCELLCTWCSIMILRFKSITKDSPSKWWLLQATKGLLLLVEKPRSKGSLLSWEPRLFEANYNSVYKTILSMKQCCKRRSGARLSSKISLRRLSRSFFPSISAKSWLSDPSSSRPLTYLNNAIAKPFTKSMEVV